MNLLPERLWPRFSLRTLFVLVAVAAVVTACFAAYPIESVLFAAWAAATASIVLVIMGLSRAIEKLAGIKSTSTLRITPPLVLIMTLWLPFSACFVFGAYVMNGHPVSMRRLAMVRVGMNETQVRNRLGTPTTVDSTNGWACWTYHGATWCCVRVRFGQDCKVIEVDHDH
jgi:hypothetical protein